MTTFTVFEGHVLALLICIGIALVFVLAKIYERHD